MLRSNEGKGFQRLPPSTTGANIPVRVRQQPGASRGLVEQREKESYRIENANCKIVDRLLSIHSRPRPVPKEHKPVKKRSSIKELERGIFLFLSITLAREIKRENERLLKRIQKNSSKATKTIDGTTISDIKGKDYQIALKRMDMISMYPQQAATRSPRVFGQKREKAIDQQHHPGEQDFDGEEGKEVNHQEEEYDLDPAYLEKPYTASDHEGIPAKS
jgi:hypothetical protein